MFRNGKWLVWLQLAVVLAVVVGALAVTAVGDPPDPKCQWGYRLNYEINSGFIIIWPSFTDWPCGGVDFLCSWYFYNGEQLVSSVENFLFEEYPPEPVSDKIPQNATRCEIYCTAGQCQGCGSLCPGPSKHVTVWL